MSKPLPMLKNSKPLEKSSLLDFLDDGQITEWFSEHGKNILYALMGIIGLLVIIYALSSSQNNKAEQEYIQAANDFTYFSKVNNVSDPALTANALDRLKGIMSNHPELNAVYGGAIAQTLLNRSQTEEAKPYAAATLARVKSNNLPFYNEYAENTLLISQQNYSQALEKSQALQQKMIQDIESPAHEYSFGDELFALNLLRIAMLQQATNNPAELQTWQEWKGYAGLGGTAPAVNVDSQAFRTVVQQLAVGSISIPDYISHREALLKK
jgi:hypothetical protein